MNEKSTKSTDLPPWEAELERLGAELFRDFPHLSVEVPSGEPESGFFRPLEIVRLPPAARVFMNALGRSFASLVREAAAQYPDFSARGGCPSLEDALAAVRDEMKYAARALLAATQVERLVGRTPAGGEMVRLAMRSVRRMNLLVRLLEEPVNAGARADQR